MLCSQEPAGCTQQVCSAGPLLLGSRPPPPLPCCVVLSGCSQPTVSLTPAASPQPPGLSKMRDTWKKVLGNKCKNHSALGEPAMNPGTKPTVGCRGFCLLPVHQLSSKVKVTHTCASHSLQLDQRPSEKVASDKGQVTRQGWATSKSPGKRTQLPATPPLSGEGTG